MSRQQRKKIDTSGGEGLAADNPFASLNPTGLPPKKKAEKVSPAPGTTPAPKYPGGRVEVRRLKGGKGGKTVTELSGFKGMSAAQFDALARELKTAAGVGGTVKEGRIEIQGDQRDTVVPVLTQFGFKPVLAGG